MTDKMLQWPNKTILVVDDDPISRMYIEKILRNITKLIVVKNGVDAVEMIKKDPHVDLVLMDLKMPVKTGFEATKEIKSLRPGLPVIAETALAFPQDRKKAKAAGCDDFIPKPIDTEALLSKMVKFLGKINSEPALG